VRNGNLEGSLSSRLLRINATGRGPSIVASDDRGRPSGHVGFLPRVRQNRGWWGWGRSTARRNHATAWMIQEAVRPTRGPRRQRVTIGRSGKATCTPDPGTSLVEISQLRLTDFSSFQMTCVLSLLSTSSAYNNSWFVRRKIIYNWTVSLIYSKRIIIIHTKKKGRTLRTNHPQDWAQVQRSNQPKCKALLLL
jgi:hypothetical protein